MVAFVAVCAFFCAHGYSDVITPFDLSVWQEDFATTDAWKARTDWLGNAGESSVAIENSVLHVRVNGAGKGMKWSREFAPISLSDAPYVCIKYRATGISPQTDNYFLFVDDNISQKQCMPVLLSDVKADGEWHTVAVDLRTVTQAPRIDGVALQLQSTSDSAEAWIERIGLLPAFPKEAELLHASQAVTNPIDIRFDSSRGEWTPQPGWLGNPSKQYSAMRDDTQAATVFRVTDSAGGMKWSHDLGETVSLDCPLYLSVRYRAKGLSKGSDYVFCLMGDPKDGGKGYESVLNADVDMSGRWRTAVIPLAEVAGELKNVKTVAAQVFAAKPGAELAISEIRFTSQRPKTPVADTVPYETSLLPDGFVYSDLTSVCNQSIESVLDTLCLEGWPAQGDIVAFGVPFHLQEQVPHLAATGILQSGALVIPIGQQTSQIFLLLLAVMAGRDEAVYGGGMLRRIAEPERFTLVLDYQDGSRTQCIPGNVSSGGFEIQNGAQVLCVETDPDKVLTSVTVQDKVAQAGFAVAAVTCLTKGARMFPQFNEDRPPNRAKRWHAAPVAGQSTCTVAEDSGSISIESGLIRMAIAPRNGCIATELLDKVTNHPLNIPDRTAPLFSLEIDEKPVTPDQVSLISATKLEDTVGVNLEFAVTSYPDLLITLQLEAATTGGIRVRGRLANKGSSPFRVGVTLSPVASCRLGGDPARDIYVFPRRGMSIGQGPASLTAQYSGVFPLQFMGVVNPSASEGIFLRTEDTACIERSYSLTSGESGITLALEYPERLLSPGETRPFADTVVEVSDGDWRRGLEAYRKWLQTWYEPAAPRKAWFHEIFNFRQRFLYWLDPLYDLNTGSMNIQRAVAEANEQFGGIDYLHIFDWGNCGPYGRIYGRKGDYSPYDYISGGREALAGAIADVRKQGIPVGLYIEGYLLDERGRIGVEHGAEWQIVGSAGNRLRWPESTELYVCPGVKPWQEIQAQTYAEKASELNVDGMYIDEFGFQSSDRACYVLEHGHPVPSYPPLTELDLTQKVRNALEAAKPGVALYTEESPCDVVSQYQDGSFTYAMNQTRTSGTVVPLNMFRFAIPDFKTFEILVCDFPTGSWAQGVRWVFFNGEGLWIEGPAEEWFAPETRDTIRKCHTILREHKDAFTSENLEPLVDTEAGLVFANRFTAQGKEMWTLYNARHGTYSGPALRIPHIAGTTWTDAWNGGPAQVTTDNGEDMVTCEIEPLGVGCLVRKAD